MYYTYFKDTSKLSIDKVKGLIISPIIPLLNSFRKP